MNALNLARMAYTSSAAPIRTNRDAEYDAFVRVTRRLTSLNPKKDFPGFALALHDNRQLWNLLAVDVADDGNQLSKELRAQIFYLAEFTSHHTTQILMHGASVDPLVEINTAIMRGLRQKGDTA